MKTAFLIAATGFFSLLALDIGTPALCLSLMALSVRLVASPTLMSQSEGTMPA